MRLLPIAGMLLIGLPAEASAAQRDLVRSYVRQNLHISSYKRADADLNGDGRPEIFIYVTDQGYCGSGGCALIVLSRQGKRFRQVLRTSINQLPISLLPTSTRGWRDVGVTVFGGGIRQPYTARLRFNGRRYPYNPTMPPAEPMRGNTGHILIR